MDRRARQKELNTLACIPIGLIGWETIIELINDAYVIGKLIGADAMMNLEMVNVKYVDGNGNQTYLQHFHVRGRKIRFVHIPDEVDVLQLMKNVTEPAIRKRKTTLREKIILKKDERTLKRYYRDLEAPSTSQPKD